MLVSFAEGAWVRKMGEIVGFALGIISWHKD